MITRQDYLNGKNTHREYYAQFVNSAVKNIVLRQYSRDALKIALDLDKNLNNIQLAEWDGMAGGLKTQLCAAKLRECGDCPTLGGAVCILKEAARQVAEELDK